MKISYNWLKEYIDIDQSPEALADILTMLGLEVGTIQQVGGIPGNLEGVVVGLVTSAEQHPNADRLRVCKVDIGAGEPLNIVCGAPNVAAGQKVPVATVGTVLHPFGAEQPLKIKKGKIRGEVSRGMICAEDELGVGTSHDGIMVLPEDTPVGSPAIDFIELDQDWVLEIDLTPNRIDGASHYGVARDLAAYFRTRPRLPQDTLPEAGLDFANPIPVEINNPDLCPRYTSIYIAGVTVQESPDWLKNRLTAIGLRPINNVVDITNYVLHELGHPMHAFDADQLAGGKVVVQTLAKGRTFVTLDEAERELIADTDLMICDAEKPLCIAGTMGGINSGVTEATKNVFLESAYFDAGSVRRTSKRLGINSDSSFRFERGADPNMTKTAALRAAWLILELAGGKASQVADLQMVETFPPFEVELSLPKTRRLIGKDIPDATIIEILEALEMEVAQAGEVLNLQVPPYRVDVQRDVDVIEDILRVYGYNQVEMATKMHATLSFDQYQDHYQLKERYADMLSANGYYEVMNNSLVHKDLVDEQAVPIVNPLSEELGVMRQSMLPGALDTLRYNQNRQLEDLAIYEFGKTYRKKGEGHVEKSWLALTVSGKSFPFKHWQQEAVSTSQATLNREIDRLQTWLGIQGKAREIKDHPDFAYGLELLVDGKVLAYYGKVAEPWINRFGIRNEVFHLLINWELADALYFKQTVTFQPIPQYPGTRRDISMVIDEAVAFQTIQEVVARANPKLIRSVELHDIYQGGNIRKGAKSYLISLELRDDNKTLADKAADKVVARAYQLLKSEVQAEIRG
ncbi:MAG: phenylalanine--tRNA ligase subunit beta [Bacteroidota bacterium]